MSGVWFVPEQPQGVLNQLFMHCPYRDGAGAAFADFAVELPRTKRVRLAFEIALRPTATSSDGATYRVRADGKCLFEEHCTWKEFRAFEVDLTSYAGQQVQLRLEVDPGPKREPREDWSLWRNVRLVAGTERELAKSQALLEAKLARRRAEAVQCGTQLAGENLLSLSSLESNSARPGLLHPAANSMHRDGTTYIFRCEGDETIEYRFDPAKGLLAGLSVSVAGQALSPAPFWGGPRVVLNKREFSLPSGRLDTALLQARADNLRLVCRLSIQALRLGRVGDVDRSALGGWQVAGDRTAVRQGCLLGLSRQTLRRAQGPHRVCRWRSAALEARGRLCRRRGRSDSLRGIQRQFDRHAVLGLDRWAPKTDARCLLSDRVEPLRRNVVERQPPAVTVSRGSCAPRGPRRLAGTVCRRPGVA